MDCGGQNFLSFWTIFVPFTSLTDPKNQNSEKMKTKQKKKQKKMPGDIIILHMCTINDNMMYGS